MKVGVIGTGNVGAACAIALVLRGCAQEIVLVDINTKRAKALATDMQYGATLSAATRIYQGNYSDLHGSSLIMITVGVNEKNGGATDRKDPVGRLKLLNVNAGIYKEIVNKIITVAPDAILLVVTDPPEPLADVARKIAGHDRIISSGTYLDSLRFRFHLAQHFKINPSSVDAQVIGEHGTSSVFLWSSATIASSPISSLLTQENKFIKKKIEQEVRFTNITIIEGINASQYGIGMVSARLTEIVLRDEQLVIPVGSYQANYDVTLSLPSVLGRSCVSKVFMPALSKDENTALVKSADVLKHALQHIKI